MGIFREENPNMKNYSVFDIIGPCMVGPSSSHTAGAVRIGLVANKLVKGKVKSANITLYGSFAETGLGHGTDRALVAGILGVQPDDSRIKYSRLLAKSEGIEITVCLSKDDCPHPNTARVTVVGENDDRYTIVGISIGGGNIEIVEINGMDVSFTGDYPTLITFYRDMPGIIAKVTAIFANMGINVAFMKVFRSAKRQDACMVIETDVKVETKIVDVICTLVPEIKEVCAI